MRSLIELVHWPQRSFQNISGWECNPRLLLAEIRNEIERMAFAHQLQIARVHDYHSRHGHFITCLDSTEAKR